MRRKEAVSHPGLFTAAGMSFAGTVGTFLTSARWCENYNWLWLSLFGLSVLILSAAAVNFDLKRWLR